MKYKKGCIVVVFEGSIIVEEFVLREDMRCITSLRKYVYRLYPHLDHSKVMVIVKEEI